MLETLNQRTRSVFEQVVDRYLETRQPVASRDISKLLEGGWSPATIRNDMNDLEDLGLIIAPHTSAGRIPTQIGLRLFVDEMIIGVPTTDDTIRKHIEKELGKDAKTANLESMLAQATEIVTGLSHYAAIVAAPKSNRTVSTMQFVRLVHGQIMAIIVFTDGSAENRVLDLKADASSLEQATNYLNARLSGKTISAMRESIMTDIAGNKTELSTLSAELVAEGLIISDEKAEKILIRGSANLLDAEGASKIEDLKALMATLEQQETVERVLSAAEAGQGVRVYIGTENKLFPHTGLSMVTAQARGQDKQLLGTIGVIGPVYMNYRQIVPLVDQTAQVMARLIR